LNTRPFIGELNSIHAAPVTWPAKIYKNGITAIKILYRPRDGVAAYKINKNLVIIFNFDKRVIFANNRVVCGDNCAAHFSFACCRYITLLNMQNT
jgi:hypothetical protein